MAKPQLEKGFQKPWLVGGRVIRVKGVCPRQHDKSDAVMAWIWFLEPWRSALGSMARQECCWAASDLSRGVRALRVTHPCRVVLKIGLLRDFCDRPD